MNGSRNKGSKKAAALLLSILMVLQLLPVTVLAEGAPPGEGWQSTESNTLVNAYYTVRFVTEEEGEETVIVSQLFDQTAGLMP